ncbi:uncharacterized protein LOC114473820 isoform X1 [Gouania willdenowi]|uniref:Insulin-like domain-containing protein n=1 Tax=Gouania willdenowi TaxID=441366 RepID=A0A8C5ET01_GOUWI|nr:plasminogen receptor (KT) isoform X1 [Gouania willdenowi]
MGFLLSKSLDANFKKQQEFMLHNSRLQLERQIQMQNQMRERQMAMQIAWSREFLKYYGAFFTVATFGLTVGAIKKKKPALFTPIIPLGFIFTYQLDSAYGTLIHRMREPHHWSSFTAESARHIWQRSEQLPDDLPPLNAAASSSSSSSLADLLALFGATGDTQQHVFIPTPMESQTIPVLPEEEESKGASDWPALKKRSFSLGVAGICCTQGCTKNDIGHLC